MGRIFYNYLKYLALLPNIGVEKARISIFWLFIL